MFAPCRAVVGDARAAGHVATRAAGSALAVVGLAGMALAGFDEAFTVGGRAVLGLRLSPAVAAVTLLAGWLLARSPSERPGDRT